MGEGEGKKNAKNYPHGLMMAPYSDRKIRENEGIIMTFTSFIL